MDRIKYNPYIVLRIQSNPIQHTLILTYSIPRKWLVPVPAWHDPDPVSPQLSPSLGWLRSLPRCVTHITNQVTMSMDTYVANDGWLTADG